MVIWQLLPPVEVITIRTLHHRMIFRQETEPLKIFRQKTGPLKIFRQETGPFKGVLWVFYAGGKALMMTPTCTNLYGKQLSLPG